MSNAANLGFAFRSPLVPPNAFMLVENLHQRKSVEASCAPQPVQVCCLLLVARKVRFFFWLRKRLYLLDIAAELGWFVLALSLSLSHKLLTVGRPFNGAELSGWCFTIFSNRFQLRSRQRLRSLSATSGNSLLTIGSLVVLVPLPWRLLLHVLSLSLACAAYLYSWSTTFLAAAAASFSSVC